MTEEEKAKQRFVAAADGIVVTYKNKDAKKKLQEYLDRVSKGGKKDDRS